MTEKILLESYERLIKRSNRISDFHNGVYNRSENPD